MQTEQTLFSIVNGNVTVLDPEGDIYVLTGRIPFDDDDTLVIVQARDSEQAKEHLVAELYDSCADEEDVAKERARNKRRSGADYYINHTTCIARRHP